MQTDGPGFSREHFLGNGIDQNEDGQTGLHLAVADVLYSGTCALAAEEFLEVLLESCERGSAKPEKQLAW